MEALRSPSALHQRIAQLTNPPIAASLLHRSFSFYPGNHKLIPNPNSPSASVLEEIHTNNPVLRRSLEIHLLDDTALIDFGLVNNKINKKKVIVGGKKESEAKKKKKEIAGGEKECEAKKKKEIAGGEKESEAKKKTEIAVGKKESKAKNPRMRRGSKAIANETKSGEKRGKIVYSMSDMEDLRYRDSKTQRKLWQKIYNAFSPIMLAEYHNLRSKSSLVCMDWMQQRV